MVILIWFILSLFDVCKFTWLPVFIDAVLISAICSIKTEFNKKENEIFLYLQIIAIMGVAIFAFYKFFFGLTISGWWLLVSPIVGFLMLMVPGGITIINLLLYKYALIELPIWGLIVGVVIDVIIFALLIWIIIPNRRDRKNM